MNKNFARWEKEKNIVSLKNDINYKIKSLYMNSNIIEVHEIFNSKWSTHIDLTYENGSILEFAALMKEYNEKGKVINELKFLEKYIEDSKIDKNSFHNAIHNILLTAINYNKKDLIIHITKEQNLIKIDFNYCECALINNCFPKNNNQIKKDIFNYFIMECQLTKTPEIEKVLKKKKREDILKIFDKIALYQKISDNLSGDKIKDKKLKI